MQSNVSRVDPETETFNKVGGGAFYALCENMKGRYCPREWVTVPLYLGKYLQ